MAIDTAESAVADNVSISRLLEFERVLALAGDRGFCFESGDLKINMFPASKASSPPGAKGSWRQPVAAAAATKAPKKHRAAKREPLSPGSACSGASSAGSGRSLRPEPPEQHQPGPSRQRRKARRAAVTAGHATAAPAPIWFLRVPRTLLTQPHMCTLLHTTTAFKSMSFSRRALPRAPRAPRTEVRPLVARARWIAAVDGRGEAWAVGLAKRPLALRAIVVPIGAQANHGRADGLRRARQIRGETRPLSCVCQEAATLAQLVDQTRA